MAMRRQSASLPNSLCLPVKQQGERAAPAPPATTRPARDGQPRKGREKAGRPARSSPMRYAGMTRQGKPARILSATQRQGFPAGAVDLSTASGEIGSLAPKAAVSLGGLAPVTRQPGDWQGRSFVRCRCRKATPSTSHAGCLGDLIDIPPPRRPRGLAPARTPIPDRRAGRRMTGELRSGLTVRDLCSIHPARHENTGILAFWTDILCSTRLYANR